MFENSLNYSFLRLPSFYLARFPRIYPDHDIHPSLLNARVSVFLDIARQVFFHFQISLFVSFIVVSYFKAPCPGLQSLPIMADHSGFTKIQPRDVGSVRKSETW